MLLCYYNKSVITQNCLTKKGLFKDSIHTLLKISKSYCH